jgi:hypothetical protein
MLALGFENTGITFEGSNAISENSEVLLLRTVVSPQASTSVSSVQVTVVPAQATPPFVAQATANLTAAAPGLTALAGVAQVRASQGDPTASSTGLVIDFQTQRTVSELYAPVAIQSVYPWVGNQFRRQQVANVQGRGTGHVSFDELVTERLLVSLASATDPATFTAGATVAIPTPPANLELLVGSTRVWFNAGAAIGDQGGSFSKEIDVTDAVRTALSGGQLPVVLTLRSSTPGQLTLTASADLADRYLVAFPEGPARTVDAQTEGVYPLKLPISAATIASQSGANDLAAAGQEIDTWQVTAVVLTVKARIPNTRVVPADGPQPSQAAELGLDQDHAFIVQLPPGSIGRLGELSGIRLLVSADGRGSGASGAELGGTLRGKNASNPSTPGDPLPKGQLGPVRLGPGAQGAPSPDWIDLKLATPHQLADGDVVWIELQTASGQLVWSLAQPQADPQDDALVLRRTASGGYVGLPTLKPGDPPWAGAIRVVGSEKANDPLPALVAGVHGDTVTTPVACVPTQAGVTIVLNLNTPTSPQQVAGSSDRELQLDLTISTPGSYAVSSAELRYKQASSEG